MNKLTFSEELFFTFHCAFDSIVPSEFVEDKIRDRIFEILGHGSTFQRNLTFPIDNAIKEIWDEVQNG